LAPVVVALVGIVVTVARDRTQVLALVALVVAVAVVVVGSTLPDHILPLAVAVAVALASMGKVQAVAVGHRLAGLVL
jgi:hypothetical protein